MLIITLITMRPPAKSLGVKTGPTPVTQRRDRQSEGRGQQR